MFVRARAGPPSPAKCIDADTPSAVRGVVTRVERPARKGRMGKLELGVESTVSANGRRVPLRAASTRVSNKGTTIALTALLGPAYLLARGPERVMPAASVVTVYTDADVPLLFENGYGTAAAASRRTAPASAGYIAAPKPP